MNKITKMLIAILASLAGSALAQTEERVFYIDFGQNNVPNQGYLTNTDANGNNWNNLHGKGTAAPDKAYALTQTTLVSADGANSDIVLQAGTTFSTNGYSNGGLQSPKKTLLGDLAIQTATQDYIFMEGSQDYGVLHPIGSIVSEVVHPTMHVLPISSLVVRMSGLARCKWAAVRLETEVTTVTTTRFLSLTPFSPIAMAT